MTSVTDATLPKFKKLYNEAVRTEKTSFMFEGQEVLVAYAKYLIEYTELRREKI